MRAATLAKLAKPGGYTLQDLARIPEDWRGKLADGVLRVQKPDAFTADDLARLPDDWCAELVEGVAVMTPAPSGYHQVLVSRLVRAIQLHLGPAGSERCMFAPLDIRLDKHTVVEPDVLLLPEGARCSGPDWEVPRPVWVAGILSPSTRSWDRGPKRRAYLDAGIADLWIIDPEEGRIESHRPDGVAVRERGDRATTPVLPGFGLDVAGYFSCD